jgi:hypothetical protein
LKNVNARRLAGLALIWHLIHLSIEHPFELCGLGIIITYPERIAERQGRRTHQRSRRELLEHRKILQEEVYYWVSILV